MRDVRVQHESLAAPKPVARAGRLDRKLPSETVDHHMARSPMLRQAAAWLEREEHQAERPSMDQACLPVTTFRRMRLRLKRTGEVGKIEQHRGPRQPSARMRPEPLV